MLLLISFDPAFQQVFYFKDALQNMAWMEGAKMLETQVFLGHLGPGQVFRLLTILHSHACNSYNFSCWEITGLSAKVFWYQQSIALGISL